MQLGTLLERLEAYRKEFGDEVQVRIFTQPNYPFENSLDGVVSLKELNEFNEMEELRPHEPGGRYGFNEGERPEAVVYLTIGKQTAYGDKAAWGAAEEAACNFDC